jgi:superfamily I DNA/RNA helicase
MTNPVVQTQFQSRTRESIEAFVRLIQETRQPLISGSSIVLKDWAHNFLTNIGYYEDLRRSEKDPEVGENRIENVKELIAGLDEAGADKASPLEKIEAFLDDLTLDSERAEEKERTGDAVTLITMHSCKGLEFPHVYVVGMEDGLLPHSRSKVEGTLDEERRLFYVAITRAMQSLSLSHCETRKKYGQVIACHPSPFLKELPQDLLEHGNAKSKQPVAVDTGKNLFASLRAQIG